MDIKTTYKAMLNVLKDPKLVIEGIRNDVKMNNGNLLQEDVNIIAERRAICLDCPFYSRNAFNNSQEIEAVTGEKFVFKPHHMRGNYCELCLCDINYKTASLGSNCGIEVLNNEKGLNLELKWHKTK